jgi:hypothetical protein
VIGRVEASPQGSNSRFIITNLAGTPRWLYPDQGAQAAPRFRSDLLHQRDGQPVPPPDPHRRLLAPAHAARLAPKTSFWRDAQFDTIRLALIKVAARVTEMVTRIKVALPSCYSHQTSWARFAARATALPP